jgi:toxin ParE1/3/4
MSSFRYSSAANANIENIILYLFDLNPVAAHHFLDRLEAACKMLAGQPLIGKQRHDLAENLRSFAVGNYLIFYIQAPHGIDIARVIYGGRDLPAIFRRP